MAKFLDGTGVQASLTDLIKNTGHELFIVSPYLKISTTMKNYLASIDQKNVAIHLIYRSDFKVSDDDKAFFGQLNNLKLYQCDNLHTKCFVNEATGIISTMNLHEHSQTHNWEMGIRFSRQEDPEIFADVAKELNLMGPHLKQITLAKIIAEAQKKYHAEPAQKAPQKLAHKPTEAPNKGLITKFLDKVTGEAAYCIRCGKPMTVFNLQKPYCDKCYASWAKYKNPKYKERYCHACGDDETNSTISFEKPTCKMCFKEYYK